MPGGGADPAFPPRFPNIGYKALWILALPAGGALLAAWRMYSRTAPQLEGAALESFQRETRFFVFWMLLFALGAMSGLALWLRMRVKAPLERLEEESESGRRAAVQIRAEQGKLLAVLNRLEEGIVLLSADGRVLAANPAARQLLPSEIPGESWEGRSFLAAVSHPGLQAFAAEAANPLRPPVLQVDKGSDAPFDLLCHLRPLGGTAGEHLLTVVNVTDFRNLDRAKSDFVANASHELKTPLSSILGYSEALMDGAMGNPRTCEPFVRKIHDNAQRLQRLVQDLLNLSQLESQPRARHVESLPVRTYLHTASLLVRGEMEKQGIRFENHFPSGLHFRMEPKDLELICNNLVGNAVRYNTPGGKVKAYWDAEARRLAIKDTGIGIPEDMLPRIFERFYRADGARVRKDGTGLGLAIVKHAAQRYGMSVRVTSRVGEGSEFAVEVPEELIGEGTGD